MKPFASFFGIPVGFSAAFWFVCGWLRFIQERISRLLRKTPVKNVYSSSQIAVVVPAHNEEIAIRKCIQALKMSVSPRQIYVVSDGSTDKTYQNAKQEKCHVSRLMPGLGKAKAIIYTIKKFKLTQKYEFIFIVDADTRIDKSFISRALPLFNDPDIGVMFGSARITWPAHILPRRKYFYVAYRERLNRLLQYFFTYGQTWKYTNTTYVIPGFATIWRSKIIKKVRLNTPGLLVEDFNTAFQVHKQKLCKIGYNPLCIGWDQHPESLKDYWNQVRRWNIAFFQTVKINGVWPSFYWLSLAIFTLEVFANSIFILFWPLILTVFGLQFALATFPAMTDVLFYITNYVPYGDYPIVSLFVSLFVVDYGFSILIGLMHKKPQFLFYGLGFIFMHYVTALILILSLIPGFFTSSAGRWTSPKRSLEQLSVKI
jgi:cellulose synthase/poly-beta-1,6-N-acetylglucosamine synthase-like glycosyltransferase